MFSKALLAAPEAHSKFTLVELGDALFNRDMEEIANEFNLEPRRICSRSPNIKLGSLNIAAWYRRQQ